MFPRVVFIKFIKSIWNTIVLIIYAVEDERIVRVSRRDPTITWRNIVEQLRLNVSSRTVRRRLKEVGLKNCELTN